MIVKFENSFTQQPTLLVIFAPAQVEKQWKQSIRQDKKTGQTIKVLERSDIISNLGIFSKGPVFRIIWPVLHLVDTRIFFRNDSIKFSHMTDFSVQLRMLSKVRVKCGLQLKNKFMWRLIKERKAGEWRLNANQYRIDKICNMITKLKHTATANKQKFCSKLRFKKLFEF